MSRAYVALVTVYVHDDADESTIEQRIEDCINTHGELDCGEVSLTDVDNDNDDDDNDNDDDNNNS